MSQQRHNDRPVESVPEVAEYERALAYYRQVREQNKAFFEQFDALVEDLNTKRQAAEKAVRSKSISCGGFHLYQIATKVDADAIYDSIGRDKFLQIGGEEITVIERKISKDAVKAAIAQKIVSEDEVKKGITTEARYHSPKPAVLP